jgi:hypothetical protein
MSTAASVRNFGTRLLVVVLFRRRCGRGDAAPPPRGPRWCRRGEVVAARRQVVSILSWLERPRFVGSSTALQK